MTQPPVREVPNEPLTGGPSDPLGDHPAIPVESEDRDLFDAPPPEPAPPTARRRFSVLPRTIAGRLVAGVVTLVLVVVMITGASTYVLLRISLFDRLDQQLDPIASGNAARVEGQIEFCVRQNRNPCQLQLSTVQGPQSAQTEWIALYLSDRSQTLQITQSPDLKLLALTADQITALQRHPDRKQTMITTDGVEVRLASRSIQVTGDDQLMVTGLSTTDVHRTLNRLLVLELSIGAFAVLLSALLTLWGVRVGLRPLHRVTRTAQEVTAELGPAGTGLQRRVPDADPTTEVGQVASSVNTLLHAVETEFGARLESEQRMRQFLADASHELRTPLTSIRGYAELARLQEKFPDRSTDSTSDTLNRIEAEGTRMSKLVEDLLALARGDQDAPAEHDPVDVDSLIDDAATAAATAHPSRTITVHPSGGAIVLGDRDQLRRVVLNLLNNAALHTAAGGPIRIEAVPAPAVPGGLNQLRTSTGTAVAIRIVDAGPGLPPEEAAHVFERFWRADKARTRAKGGSGLGLAIVSQIVERHGGAVSFDSSVEFGTTVSVTLPTVDPASLGTAESDV